MTYLQAIREAKERYAEAMEGAAWDALAIVDQFGRPLETVCKAIAGDEFKALASRSRRLRKAAGQTAAERERVRQATTKRKAEETVRRMAKADPDFVARAVAKANPGVVMEVAAEAAGRVRETASEAASTPLLSERWERWFNQLGNLMIEGARLAEETDDADEVLDGYAPVARLFYDRLRERQFDAEWRQVNESIDAES